MLRAGAGFTPSQVVLMWNMRIVRFSVFIKLRLAASYSHISYPSNTSTDNNKATIRVVYIRHVIEVRGCLKWRVQTIQSCRQSLTKYNRPELKWMVYRMKIRRTWNIINVRNNINSCFMLPSVLSFVTTGRKGNLCKSLQENIFGQYLCGLCLYEPNNQALTRQKEGNYKHTAAVWCQSTLLIIHGNYHRCSGHC